MISITETPGNGSPKPQLGDGHNKGLAFQQEHNDTTNT